IAGLVLMTGASLGHVLRGSGRGAARAGVAVSRGARSATLSALRGSQRLGEQVRIRREGRDPATPAAEGRSGAAPLDRADRFPDLFAAPGALPPSPALRADEAQQAPPRLGQAELPVHEEPGEGPVEPAPAQADEPPAAAAEPPRGRPWRPPTAAYLRRSRSGEGQSTALVRETSGRLVETLGHFGIQATVTDAVGGPRVTRYELQLAPGTKVSRVSALRDDLAYALAAREEIRII